MYAGHLDLNIPLVWTAEAALPGDRCDYYATKIRTAEAETAPVITKQGTEIDLAVRNNTRIMWDDEAEANRLLEHVTVPARLSGCTLVGANPRLRLYRYTPGQRHSAHWDTVVELADGVRSLLTLVFYLNDDFTGGETDFPELKQRITPKRGSALIFQHRVLHEAMQVSSGEKLVLRTDVLYG